MVLQVEQGCISSVVLLAVHSFIHLCNDSYFVVRHKIFNFKVGESARFVGRHLENRAKCGIMVIFPGLST